MSRQKSRPTYALCLILLLGAFLRFYDLDAESYWLDEIVTVQMLDRGMQAYQLKNSLSQPPVYMIPGQLWVSVLGTDEVITRSLSAFVGVISIVLIYQIGRHLLGVPVGIVAALLMTISEFQIHYAQETRYYIVYELTALLSMLGFIRVLKAERFGTLLIYISATILLIYSHLFGVFVVAAQVVYLLFRWIQHKRIWRGWLISQVVIGVSLIPQLIPFLVGGSDVSSDTAMVWIPDRPLWYPIRTIYLYLLPLRHQRTWREVGLSFLFGGAFLVVGTAAYAVRTPRHVWLVRIHELIERLRELLKGNQAFTLLLVWLLSPILFPMLLSYLVGPMYVDKYTIGAAPALYLLLGAAIVAVRDVVPVGIVFGALAFVIVPGLQHYYAADIKEPWSEIASYIEDNARADDVIVFAPAERGWVQANFDWYFAGGLSACEVDNDIEDEREISEVFSECVSGHERFWLIIRGGPERTAPFRTFFLETDSADAQLLEQRQFTSIGLYLFALRFESSARR